ncbi:DUF1349 domain-containing protein [Ruania albidiflava]|uniref:DUF1349 domain-containing protein n=1 Tax=Ruania albidiflava TaxID=366586 RepID=UPI0003B3CB4A|nr:DUF1349 domain-containing protein [Ruania albidiflava]
MTIASRLRRRLPATLTVLAGMVALAAPTQADTAPPPADWPVFGYQGVITIKDEMIYNPTDEFIFPSIFHAGAYFEDPLGEWYLYYAPHDNPGGISLMYADSLEGPWTEYAENPLITNEWDPYYAVPHVSSPDAIWNTEADRMFLYFHGSNAQTRWAETDDGITFDYGGIAVDNAMGGPEVTETSYARVFEHPDPDSGYAYAMFYMGNERDDIRRIRLAESVDGRTWQVDPDYVVAPGDEEGKNVSGGDLWEWNDQLYVIYHASSGNVYARTIDASLREVGEEPILLHSASGLGDDVGRIAAPEIVTDHGEMYMFYESGDRLGATIAWAKEGADVIMPPPFGDFPEDPENPVFAQCAADGSDEFEGGAPTDVWDRVVRAEAARHQVAGGQLVVPTYTGGVAAAPLLQQELPNGPWQVTTRVTIDATQKFQQAGLLLYADDTHYAKLDLGRATPGPTVELVYHRGGQNRQDSAAPEIEGTTTIWLRYTSDGDTIRASVSYDGQTFTRYGRDIDAAEAGFTHVGPYAFRGTTVAAEISASFDWVRFSPGADAYTTCQQAAEPLPADEETAPPARGVLSSTSGWATGLHDGSYEVRMNLWWGANASRVELYENGALVAVEDLVAAGPTAQSVTFPVQGRANGEYTYTAVLRNSQGSSTTEPLLVRVTDAEPGVAHLSHDNDDHDGDYRITADMWWGTDADRWVLYEDGEQVADGRLQASTPRAQHVEVALTGRAPGEHVYVIELANDAGSTSSEPLTVTVRD